MGKVKDTYLVHEKAGDAFVGRTVTGLPINSEQFAAFPPHFVPKTSDDNRFIKESIEFFFPSSPETLHKVLEFCLVLRLSVF